MIKKTLKNGFLFEIHKNLCIFEEQNDYKKTDYL